MGKKMPGGDMGDFFWSVYCVKRFLYKGFAGITAAPPPCTNRAQGVALNIA